MFPRREDVASRREDLNKDYQARIINPRPSAGDCYEELTNGIVRIMRVREG